MKKVLSFAIALVILVQCTAVTALADYDHIDLSECAMTLSAYTCEYSGKANTPSADIISPYDVYLLEGVDYYLTYSNNINAGKGKVTAHGMGDYTGTISETFTVKRRKITSADVYLWNKSVTYNGKARKPLVSVYFPNTDSEMTQGKHYTITYKNNVKPGKGKFTVKGIGNYTGTITQSFKIVIGTVTKLKTKTVNKSTVKLSWKKQTAVTGYQVQKYNKNSKKWKTVKTIKKNNASCNLKGATLGTKHKYRVRAYKKIGKKTYYGKYSKAKTYIVAMPKKVTGLHDVYNENLYGMYYETKLAWKKQPGVSGYQVRFLYGDATNYESHYYKLSGCNNNSDTFQISITSIPIDIPFYYVRAYTVINGKTYYGPWTAWS